MEARTRRICHILKALGGRRLAWFATRGLDTVPLARTGLLSTINSLISPLSADPAGYDVKEDCLEVRLQRREDMNIYDIDEDARLEACSFRQQMLDSRVISGTPSDGRKNISWLLGAYRPSRFLTAIQFTRSDVSPGYMLAECQRVFEHKPWVERELERAGVKTLGWIYVRDSESYRIHQAIEDFGRVVVRSTYSAGGVGLRLAESARNLHNDMPAHDDGFVAYSPYYEDNLSLNLNACIYPGGKIRCFHLSVQLIGLPACTRFRFGFCGNDFATASVLDSDVLMKIESISKRVGRWAFSHGYRGQFGIDFILHQEEPLVAEINPRFQASSYLSESIAESQGITGPYLEHIAAFLDLPPPATNELPDLVHQTAECNSFLDCIPLSQIVCYNDRGADVKVVDVDDGCLPEGIKISGTADRDVVVAPGGMLGKVEVQGRVTETGSSLLTPFSRIRSVFHTRQVF